jgi:hypothetical protein
VTFAFNNLGPGCYTTDVLSVNSISPANEIDGGGSGCSAPAT